MKRSRKIFCANGAQEVYKNPPQRSAPVPNFLQFQLKGNRQFLRKLTHGEFQNLTDCDFRKHVRSAHIAVSKFNDLRCSGRKVKTDFSPFIVVVCIPMYCFVLVQRRRFFCFCRSASIPPHREHRHPPIVQSACPRSFCRLALRRWWCCTRKR